MPWRQMPKQFGPWGSVYTRFRRWCACGLWEKMLKILRRRACGKIRSVDCTHVKVHRDGANPAGGQLCQGIGRTKGGLNSKIAGIVDALGRAVALDLAPGQQADIDAITALKPFLYRRWVVADRGFDAAHFREDLARNKSVTCIPPRSGRRINYYYCKKLYRTRHTVENFFCRIKFNRRVATRYEKLAVTFMAFVTLASVIDWLCFEV